MKGHTNGRAPRIVLAGAVNSSRLTFEALQRHQASLVGVLGLSPQRGHRVSGYVDLAEMARAEGVASSSFDNINDEWVMQRVADWDPDLLMVVGL